MYVVCPLDIALVFKWDLLCNPYSKHSCHWQVNDAWHPPLFKGHKEFPRDPQPPNLRITEHSTNKFLPRKEAVWPGNEGGLGAILRKANGFIIWDIEGPALLEAQMKAKWCGRGNSGHNLDPLLILQALIRVNLLLISTVIHHFGVVSGLQKTPAISSTALKLFMTCFILFTTLF